MSDSLVLIPVHVDVLVRPLLPSGHRDFPHPHFLAADDLQLIPTPGHTEGSSCLLHRETHLFTGDHLAWSTRLRHPYAFRDACWYSWPELVKSMERVAKLRFEWILPGHGHPCHFEAAEMATQMERCVEWCREP